MCGIAGVIRHGGLAPDDSAAVLRMMDAQRHRGPDGGHCVTEGPVVLGHRRLSIIDLSDAGTQPMCNEDRTVWLTFNGEIYNFDDLHRDLVPHGHRFRSRTDSEVLVHGYEQWGLDGLLAKLEGMFAFGLYDGRLRQLFLVRDHVGIKPLYYHHNESAGLLAFASEVKALTRSGLTDTAPDTTAVAGFLMTGSVPSPRTIVRGVSSLPQGYYAVWNDGRLSLRRYWEAPFAGGTGHYNAGVAEQCEERLASAAARHLVSDVPLGVFLGGGVDSAAVVSFAARALRRHGSNRADVARLKTLTVTFDEAEFSEAAAARATADSHGTEHREVRVTQDDFLNELPRVFDAMDQPTNDGVNTYFVSRAARQAGLTVVLSGLGGDEVFWGYNHYRRLGAMRWLANAPAAVRRTAGLAAAAWGRATGQDRWMRSAFLGRSAPAMEMYLLMRGFFSPSHLQSLMGLSAAEVTAIADEVFAPLVTQGQEPLEVGFNRIEFGRYLHDQLLRDSDIFSMAHSLELRVPLLDRRVLEYVLPCPSELKIKDGTNKPLLAEAANDPEVMTAARTPKRGFTFPMDRWMRVAADDLSARAGQCTTLDIPAVNKCWTDFRAGHLHWSRAWALTVVGAHAFTGAAGSVDTSRLPAPATAIVGAQA